MNNCQDANRTKLSSIINEHDEYSSVSIKRIAYLRTNYGVRWAHVVYADGADVFFTLTARKLSPALASYVRTHSRRITGVLSPAQLVLN